MDASSGSRFYIAQAEESPSPVVAAVSELEALTMVGAKEASTSGRSEYCSARCEEMMRSRGHFCDDVALEIAFSKSHRTEVDLVEVEPESAEEEKLNRENREALTQLRREYPVFHGSHFHGCVLGRMIAEGGQGKIYEVVGSRRFLMKVFRKGTSLHDLKRSWPLPVMQMKVWQCIVDAGLLEDGRFAFVMWRYWGDLRKLIDRAMQEKNADGFQGPPFPFKLNKFTLHPTDFMSNIALQMQELHEKGVFHRDLKASNILLCYLDSSSLMWAPFHGLTEVADFECSIGVLGTGFWRAPEILLAQSKRETIRDEQWEKADVYSYGMVCFEIVTGRIPFDGELKNTKVHRQLVIDGKRPQLPSDLDERVKDLITKCWASDPRSRPTFLEIVDMVETISQRQCQFRLFGIGDKLPPQYHLATIEEVDEYPCALARAMPGWEIANLANGSVDGCKYGMKKRLEKRSDVGHNLARLHQ